MFLRRPCSIRVLLAAISFLMTGRLSSQTCASAEIVDRAKELLGQKRYEEAATKLDELRSCSELTPLQSFEVGWLYGRARHFDTALRIFKRVPEGVPDRLTHGYAIALSEFELSYYQAAVKDLEALRSQRLTDSKASNLLAVSYSKLGLFKEAYAVLNQQVETDANDLTTYLNLITVCAEGGDYGKAAELATQAEAHFPNSPDLLIDRGAAYTLSGRTESAIQDFAAAVRLAPDRPDARFFLALADYNQAKYSEAIAALKQAEQDGVQDPDLHYLMAECLLKADRAQSPEALAELDRALKLNSNSVAARTLRGRLLLEKGQLKEAIADLEIANRFDPGSRSTLYNLARAYRSTGQTARAEALFRQLRSEKPDTLKELGDRRLNDTLAQGVQP
jgi:tetratricopeptide (TPR) repeat protein